MDNTIFVEIQRCREVAWAWGLVAGLFVFYLVFGRLHRLIWLIGAFQLGLMVWFIWVGRMTTAMTPQEIRIRGFPINIPYDIPVDSIREFQAIQYRPIQDYGGWGYRHSPQGIAFSCYGDRGVQLILTNDKRVLIGSQRADELAAAIDQAKRTAQGRLSGGK